MFRFSKGMDLGTKVGLKNEPVGFDKNKPNPFLGWVYLLNPGLVHFQTQLEEAGGVGVLQKGANQIPLEGVAEGANRVLLQCPLHPHQHLENPRLLA